MSNKYNTSPRFLPLIYHPDYQMDFGGHVFRTQKYSLALQMLREAGLTRPGNVSPPEPADAGQITLVHTREFLADFEGLRWTPRTMFSELPISEEIVRGFKLMVGGTIQAGRLALDCGVAMHLGGGFHHAFADRAEGFCYLNDIAILISLLRKEGRIRRAAVIDVDLHQGNGTAKIFELVPEVLTFSIHQERLYPDKQRSDIDIGLDEDTGDAAYLEALRSVVPDRIAEHDPELVVYVAGADPYAEDQLGQLKLSMEGLRERDRLVATACRERGWPMVVVLAGGYALKSRDTARIHANTGLEIAKAWGIEPAGENG